MKSIITSLFLIFVLFTQAQENLNTEKSLLWEISGKGLEQSSYIFGTIHLIPKDDYFFTDIMKEKLKACQKLILEVDINLSLADKIDAAKSIILPDGKSLSDLMSEDDYSAFQSYLLDSLGIKKSTFKKINKIKPLYSSALIINELTGKTKTYEKELNKMAEKNGMEVIGLESLKFQLDLINNISIEDQIKMITEEEMSGNPMDIYNNMVDAYIKQDLTSLKNLMDTDDSMLELGDDFIKNRNTDWIPKIETYISKSPVFIAVGAGHLPGNEGVLNLLREKGYTITPVK